MSLKPRPPVLRAVLPPCGETKKHPSTEAGQGGADDRNVGLSRLEFASFPLCIMTHGLHITAPATYFDLINSSTNSSFRFRSNPAVAVFTGASAGLCLPHFHLLDWRRMGVQDVWPHRGKNPVLDKATVEHYMEPIKGYFLPASQNFPFECVFVLWGETLITFKKVRLGITCFPKNGAAGVETLYHLTEQWLDGGPCSYYLQCWCCSSWYL